MYAEHMLPGYRDRVLPRLLRCAMIRAKGSQRVIRPHHCTKYAATGILCAMLQAVVCRLVASLVAFAALLVQLLQCGALDVPTAYHPICLPGMDSRGRDSCRVSLCTMKNYSFR